jgi:mercuric ion transport protein
MKAAFLSVGTALFASACCIGPVAFSLIGAGALGASAVRLEPYRPWFIGITVLVVGMAFYSAYRPTFSQDHCADGVCPPQSKRLARLLAWTSGIVAAVLIAFPYSIGWADDYQAAEKPTTQVSTLKVSGMTCAGCEAAVRMAARSVQGVREVKASHAKANAEVTYDPSKTTPEAIAKAITDKSGFKAEPVLPARTP